MKGWVVTDNGPVVNDDEEIVSIDLLQQLCLQVEDHLKNQTSVVHESQLRNLLSGVSQRDFELVFVHLQENFSKIQFDATHRLYKYNEKISEAEIVEYEAHKTI